MDTLPLDDAYQQVRDGGVVVHRPERGLLRLAGPQRIWFLENTITNAVEGTEPGRWVESCFLQLKGKVLAHFRVGVLPDEAYLDVDPPGTGPLVDWMIRYRFRTKVDIDDVSVGSYTVLGPPARELAADGEVHAGDGRVTFGGTLGDVPTADVHAAEPTPEIADLPRASFGLHDVLRIEAGLGRFGVDYGEDTLAQEAGLSRVVSATKGCYVGQEVVAKLHFRGKVSRVLRALAFEGPDDPASLVGRDLQSEGKRVGHVTSAVRSPERGTIGIGLVRVDVPTDGYVEVDGDGKARVGPIPEGTKTEKTTPRRPG